MQDTVIYFATDHAGFELKNALLSYVRDELGYQTVDCGAYTLDPEDDFTDFISKAAREVSASSTTAKAIILGGSGQGEAMLANRFHDVRAVVYYGGDEEIVTLSREHNDANVLSLGARFLEETDAKRAVALWLRTPHRKTEKYDRRIEEIEIYSASTPPKFSLLPSLPASSFLELESFLRSMEGTSKEVQIDIVDGKFVPHTSWPFTEESVEEEIMRLAPFATTFDIEIDCMCMDPFQYLDLFSQLGVKRVIVHEGATKNLSACITHAKEHGYKIGLAFTNDADLSKMKDYLSEFDFIQVMGIAQVGRQGQPFDERTLDTVARIRKVNPLLEIAVDGAVNEKTIPLLIQAGANRFAPGSAIARATDPKEAYKQLHTLVHSSQRYT